jgi:prepilin-type N-terminal cleavage/methylation domain-containing protein
MKRRKGNKGFTLVEMVVVIAVTMILFSLAVLSMNLVTNANVKAAAKRMAFILKTARTKTMAKGPEAGKVTITTEGGNVYATIGTGADATVEQICNSAVKYTGPTTIQFNTDGTLNMLGDTTTSTRKIVLFRGSRTYEITIYKETGAVITNWK